MIDPIKAPGRTLSSPKSDPVIIIAAMSTRTPEIPPPKNPIKAPASRDRKERERFIDLRNRSKRKASLLPQYLF